MLKTSLPAGMRAGGLILAASLIAAGVAPVRAEPDDGMPPMADHDPDGPDGPGGHGGPGGPGGPETMMNRMIISRLSPEGRRILADSFRRGMPDEKERAALDGVREKILDIISAPTLDARALDAAFQRERQLATAMQTRRQQAMLDTFKRLSPSDRKLFAQGLRKIHPDVRKRMIRKEFRDAPPRPPED